MKIIVLVSGGIDSTAVLLKALEQFDKDSVLAIFADTKFVHPITYKYLDYLEKQLDITIIRVANNRYPNGLVDLIKVKKMFPSHKFRFCTTELKIKPTADYLIKNSITNGEMWVGIRLSESNIRKRRYIKYLKYDVVPVREVCSIYPKKLMVRFPILSWSLNKVIRYLKSNDIIINPLYKIVDRVSCFPCLLGGKKMFKKCLMDEVGRRNIKELIKLEEEIGMKISCNVDVRSLYIRYVCNSHLDVF